MSKIDSIKKELSDFRSKYESELDEIFELSEKLSKVSDKLKSVWSGSNAGFHAFIYYEDFEVKPSYKFSTEWGTVRGMPNGWKQYDPTFILNFIEKGVDENFKNKDLEKKSKLLLNRIKDLKDSIDDKLPKNESIKIKRVRDFIFPKPLETKNEYISARIPTRLATRDSEALLQGTGVPSHLVTQAIAYECQIIVEKVSRYFELVENLDSEIAEEGDKKNDFHFETIHPEIKKKCKNLFLSGNYSESAEKSFKVVKDKLRSI